MSFELRTVGEVCELVTDGTHYTPPDIGVGVSFLTVKDMNGEGLDFKNSSKISDEEYQRALAGNSAPKLGDVLFSKDGTVGKVHVVRERQPFAVLSSIAILRPAPSVLDSNYFGHVLQMPQTIDQASRKKTGSALRRIILKDLKGVKIPLPPLAEQRRIAAILDKADALRAKRRAALAKLDTLLQATFLDMFGDPVTNPMGWEVKPLENVINFKTGKLDSNAMVEGGQYPFFTCAREVFEIDHYAFDCEALLMAGNNASADYWVKHYTGKFNAYQRTYVMTLKNADLSYKYMRLAMEYKLAELKRISKGTNTRYLTLAILKPLTVQIPSRVLMIQFEKIHDKITERQWEMEKAFSQLDNLFHSLQQRAFKGEL